MGFSKHKEMVSFWRWYTEDMNKMHQGKKEGIILRTSFEVRWIWVAALHSSLEVWDYLLMSQNSSSVSCQKCFVAEGEIVGFFVVCLFFLKKKKGKIEECLLAWGLPCVQQSVSSGTSQALEVIPCLYIGELWNISFNYVSNLKIAVPTAYTASIFYLCFPPFLLWNYWVCGLIICM